MLAVYATGVQGRTSLDSSWQMPAAAHAPVQVQEVVAVPSLLGVPIIVPLLLVRVSPWDQEALR